MHEVHTPPVPPGAYDQVLGSAWDDEARARLGRRTVWQVNSTSAGGGVAEMLHRLIPLARGAGVDVRWLVISCDAEMLTLTKRLCLRLYGSDGDGGPLGEDERRHFDAVTAVNTGAIKRFVRPGDVVVVHDPQPAGLIPAIAEAGAVAVWRCHVGCDAPGENARQGWDFLRPYLADARALVFSTRGHVPEWAPDARVIPPSIDPCGPKNMPLRPEGVRGILAAAGILEGPGQWPASLPGGSLQAEVHRHGPAPAADVPMVVQVSRWDRLKGMSGVLRAFASADHPRAYLTLAGPVTSGVADDPEGAAMFAECRREWQVLPDSLRRQVQLVCLPMEDLAANAVAVNALQRHAAVVVQNSVAEGFGLTLTEAMWKARPVVATAVGGLRGQLGAGAASDRASGVAGEPPGRAVRGGSEGPSATIGTGECGVLVDDSAGLAKALIQILDDPGLARRLGEAAQRRVTERYLPDRHLRQWADLLMDLVPP